MRQSQVQAYTVSIARIDKWLFGTLDVIPLSCNPSANARDTTFSDDKMLILTLHYGTGKDRYAGLWARGFRLRFVSLLSFFPLPFDLHILAPQSKDQTSYMATQPHASVKFQHSVGSLFRLVPKST